MNTHILALKETDLGRIGGEGLGPFGNTPLSATEGLMGISSVISSTIGIITVSAGIWFIFQFLVGGLNWATAAGDKQKLQDARARITNGFIGLLIVVAGWSILALAGQFFGLEHILISNPDDLKDLLKIQ